MNCYAMAVSILLLRMVCVCCRPLFSVSEMKTFFLVKCGCSFCINIGCVSINLELTLCDVWYDVLHPLDVDFDLFYAGGREFQSCKIK